jgi:hypothetical protein
VFLNKIEKNILLKRALAFMYLHNKVRVLFQNAQDFKGNFFFQTVDYTKCLITFYKNNFSLIVF